MSWQCTSWALREAPAPTSTARLVLIALADRCQPDGRSAWPTIETLALEAHTSESSVKRALKSLEECGAIRRGNQLLAQWDEHGQWVPEQYRSIVWECCMGVSLEHVAEKPGRRAREERAQRCSADSNHDSSTINENSGVKMTPLKKIENKPIPSGVKMTPLNVDNQSRGSTSDTSRGSTSDTSIKETNSNKQIPPLPPTVVSPPQGANHSGSMIVDKFLDALAEKRARLGLTTAAPSARDRESVMRLVDRLVLAGSADPLAAMLMVLDSALNSDFQAKRCDSGRRFANLFDELRNDMIVDARRSSRSSDAAPIGESSSSSTPPQQHVPSMPVMSVDSLKLSAQRLVDSSSVLAAVEPDPLLRHAFDSDVAKRLELGVPPAAIVDWLAGWLKIASAAPNEPKKAVQEPQTVDREKNRRALSAMREAHGGHLFVGMCSGVAA